VVLQRIEVAHLRTQAARDLGHFAGRSGVIRAELAALLGDAPATTARGEHDGCSVERVVAATCAPFSGGSAIIDVIVDQAVAGTTVAAEGEGITSVPCDGVAHNVAVNVEGGPFRFGDANAFALSEPLNFHNYTHGDGGGTDTNCFRVKAHQIAYKDRFVKDDFLHRNGDKAFHLCVSMRVDRTGRIDVAQNHAAENCAA